MLWQDNDNKPTVILTFYIISSLYFQPDHDDIADTCTLKKILAITI